MYREKLVEKLVLSILVLELPAMLPAEGQDPCSSDKSHQFDFWIGDWEVYEGENVAGYNTIEPILDGCVLQESWRGLQGSAGSSFNFFDPQTGQWRQFWVWRNSSTLELAGDFEDGKMVLEGESMDREGRALLNRITWYDNRDGTVRQHWQTSVDRGATWVTAFDGLYKRKE